MKKQPGIIMLKDKDKPKRFATKGIVTDKGRSWEVTFSFEIHPKIGKVINIKSYSKPYAPKSGTIEIPDYR